MNIGSPDDRRAIQELNRVSRAGTMHRIQHYLYFPDKTAAVSSAAAIRSRGFETEIQLGADRINWLVLAQHYVVPTEEIIAAVRAALEELADEACGEYDGWEAEVQQGDEGAKAQ
jgi:hypothetical protein